MIKFPDKVLIGDHYYRIRQVKSIRGCKKPVTQKGVVLGLADPNRREILMRVEMSDDEKLKTLIHECIHIAEEEYDIAVSHESVYKFEEFVFDFIMANLNK